MKIGLIVGIVMTVSCTMNGKADRLDSAPPRPRLSEQEIADRKSRLNEMTKRALESERTNRKLTPFHAAIAAATDPVTGNVHLDRVPADIRVQHEAALTRERERQEHEDGPTELFVGLVGKRPQWQLREILTAAVAGFNALHHQRLSRDQCVSRMRELLNGLDVTDAQLELLLGVGSLKDLWKRP